MISKRIKREPSKSDIRQLICYILDLSHSASETLWMTSEEYQENLIDGKKLGGFNITNCEGLVPGMAMAEMIATQKKNTRAKTDKVYHLVISFPEGERPMDAQLADIEETFASALGFAEHQRLSAIHRDTENLHLHVAINKIHPRTFNCLEPYNDYYIRDQTCLSLEKKHGLTIDNHGRQKGGLGKAAVVEMHGDKESFLRWVRETAGQSLLHHYEMGGTWQGFHECLATFNLEIKPRGAGLVICEKGGGVAVKASSVDPMLSFQSLTERWGKFEAQTAQGPVSPVCAYKKSLLRSDNVTDVLYKEYQESRSQVLSLRDGARSRLRCDHAEYVTKLKAWYAERRKNIKQNPLLSREEKQIEYKRVFVEQSQQRAEWKEQGRSSRDAIVAKFPLMTWGEFLVSKAEAGHEAALLALRRHRRASKSSVSDFLTSAGEGSALVSSHFIQEKVKHRISQKGDIIYSVADGGAVIDEGKCVRVDLLTREAAFLALVLAEQHFKERPLIVEGSREFKQQVVLTAADKFNVTFADEGMEQERRLQAQKKSEAVNVLAPLQDYLASRNALLGKVSDVIPHRAWTARDLGEMIYQGKRTLRDGSSVILLRYQGEMVVKPVTPTHAADISRRCQVGGNLILDKNGHYKLGVGKQR